MATQLDMAEQQLYGWHCAQTGERLPALVSGMGLTRAEWNQMLKDGSVEYLTFGEVCEIDHYFMTSQDNCKHGDKCNICGP